jgi:hypothetical protein
MMRSLMMAAAAALVLTGPARAGEKVAPDKLPNPVTEAVAKRFPKAEVKGASKDGTGDKTVYEVTLKESGKNIDVSLTPAGGITQIEQELAFKDLPKPVAATFEKKYPKATYTIIEAVIAVKDGKEVVEYYEAVVVTADKKTFEAEVLADGTFKEEKEKTDKKPPQLALSVVEDDEKGKKGEKAEKSEKKGEKKGEDGEKGSDLPTSVASAVKSKFPGMKVVSAEKEDEDWKTVYEIKLKAKGATLEAVLTTKGDVVSVKVKKGEDDEKGEVKKSKKKGEDDGKNEKGKQKGEKKEKGDRD